MLFVVVAFWGGAAHAYGPACVNTYLPSLPWELLETDAALEQLGHVNCDQASIIGERAPPSTRATIGPREPLQPFYQWNSNNGYCGETSLIQAGLNSGQWISEYDARALCGSGLSQSGPEDFCREHDDTPNFNAQLLLDSRDPRDAPFADAATCLSNFRLSFTQFDHDHQSRGTDGYKEYMSWIKAQVIAGKQVTIGMATNGGTEPEYDHIVTVARIGTNHSPSDPRYYDDDVLYIEDHGESDKKNSVEHPAIPHGARRRSTKRAMSNCEPFVFGYTFRSLARTRREANAEGKAYSIIVPSRFPLRTKAGGDGIHAKKRQTSGGNYGFAVAGPLDTQSVLQPVSLKIVDTFDAKGQRLPPDLVAGRYYEFPMIKANEEGDGCTNERPEPMGITFEATCGNLVPGKSYNLYEYDFSEIKGVGRAAQLAVPSENFNAQANLASRVTKFEADSPNFRQKIVTDSHQTVILRCVPADAP